MLYVGIDLGVDLCSASVVDEQGNIKTYLEFKNEEKGWEKLMNAIEPDSKIAMEATTSAYPLHDYLRIRGYDVHVGHPTGIKAITYAGSKTDKKDSEVLANLLRLNYLPRAYIPTPEMLKTRDLLRARIKTGVEITRVKNRIKAFIVKNGLRSKYKTKQLFGKYRRKTLEKLKFGDYRDCLVKTMYAQYECLEHQKKQLEKEIAKISITDGNVILLMSIPGIDFYTALVIINEIGDIFRFKTAEALCKYAGLVPRVHSSANIIKMAGITKAGPSTLRWAAALATERIIKSDNPISQFYRRLSNRKKSKKLAKTATARKVLVMVYHMLKNNERCRWENKLLTRFKINKLQRACQWKVQNA